MSRSNADGAVVNRRDCDAVVDLWYPGDQGGPALADVLFGEVSPAGRSSQTWYPSDDAMPPQGLMTMHAGDGSPGWTYRYWQGNSSLPFGFVSARSVWTVLLRL